MYDFVLPNDNEDIIIEGYKKVGIRNIILCYIVKEKEDLKLFERRNIKYYKNINTFVCALIDNSDIKKTLELSYELFYSEKLYNDLIMIKGRDYEYNMKILNKYQFNFILNPIKYDKKYFFGGIGKNDIKKMVKNNIYIVYSIKDILKNKKNISSIIFFNKKMSNKVKFLIGTFSSRLSEIPNKYQILSFYKIFGIKYNEDDLFFQIKRCRLAKRKDYFMKGFYIAKYPYEDCREF